MHPIAPYDGYDLPLGWRRQTLAEDQPEYQPLPVIVNAKEASRPMTSCWQLTWGERLCVLLTGRMFWTQLTFGQPLQPQLPTVEGPLKITQARTIHSSPRRVVR